MGQHTYTVYYMNDMYLLCGNSLYSCTSANDVLAYMKDSNPFYVSIIRTNWAFALLFWQFIGFFCNFSIFPYAFFVFFCNVWATLMAILYVTLKGCQDGDQMISYSYQISLRCPLLFCLGSSWFEWSNVQVLLIKSFGAICICILGLFGNVFLNFFLTLSAPNLVVMSGGY